MNNYNDFKVNDWLEDPTFQDWVYKGSSDDVWRTYLENNPSQIENVEQAKSILLSVRGELDIISRQEVKFRVSQLLNSISEKNEKLSWWRGRWLRAAAAIILASCLGAYCWDKYVSEPQPYYAMLSKLNGDKMIEVINESDKIKLVNLPDGSSVILKKNARISYPSVFDVDKREVYLLGEAFFEVEKNPDRPLFVYAGEMITKVTGTSFSIQANEREDEVKLVVKTGVVEVSAVSQGNESDAYSTTKKNVLSPNQLITMSKKSLGITIRNVESSILINLPIESFDFSFKRMPLKEVFETLEMAYGVQIIFDRAVTEGCTITAKLGDEPVYEKLEMICAVVGATYNIKNNAISIYSNGCEN